MASTRMINSSNSSLSNVTQPGLLSSDLLIIYITVTGTTVIGVVINLIAILMILIRDKVKTASDGLILHLMFCDLITVIIMPVCTIAVVVNNSIGLPHQIADTVCKIAASAPMSYDLIAATLTLMSVERYRAVIHPMEARMSGKKVLVILLVIWLVSIAIAIAAISETRADPLYPSHCIFYSDETRSVVIIIAMIYLALAGYIAPLIIMLYCYTKIISKLRFLTTITGSNVTQESYSQVQKKRIIKTLIAVSAIFMCTGIPFVFGLLINIYAISKASKLSYLDMNTSSIFTSIGTILLILAITCNPIIYFIKKLENCNKCCYYKIQTISSGTQGNGSNDNF